MKENVEALVAKLVQMAMGGDAPVMAILVDHLAPKIQRHELEAADAPTKLVIEFRRRSPHGALYRRSRRRSGLCL